MQQPCTGMMFLPNLLSFVSSVHIFEEFRTLGRGVFADDKISSPYEARDCPILRQEVAKMVCLGCMSRTCLILDHRNTNYHI